MDWHADVDAALPAPDTDDPVELRSDLVDEITDHLHCAYQRELHTERNEGEARERVLARFGSPRAILRQLWFEALKERLVSQRITMVAAVVLAVASLAACGVTWSAARGVQEANRDLLARSEVANRKLLAQSEATNRELLALIAARPVVPPEPVATPEWNPLTIELVGRENGTPLEGWTVEVRGFVHEEARQLDIDERTDAHGRADFGMVRPGNHHVAITSPWGEQASGIEIGVRPGRALLERIECPKSPPTAATVEIGFDMIGWNSVRKALKEENVALIVGVTKQARKVDERIWYDVRSTYLSWTPDGALRTIRCTFNPSSKTAQYSLPVNEVGGPLAEQRLSLPVGTYTVKAVVLVRTPEGRAIADGDSLTVLAPILDRNSRTYPPFGTEETLELSEGNEVTSWTISVPRGWTADALAAIAMAEHDIDPASADSVRSFFYLDENDDSMVSIEEFDKHTPSGQPKFSEGLEADWPLDVKGFVPLQEELRKRWSTPQSSK